MPRGLPRFAFCAAPGDAKSHKNLDGLLGTLVSLWFSSKTVAIFVASLFGVVIPMIILGPCFGVIPATIMIVGLLQEAKDWYYSQRLLCIEDRDNCVVGSVLHQPEVSTDGDRKMDLLLAPFTEPECYELICRHLNNNEVLLNSPSTFNNPPFFTGTVPVLYDQCDPDILTNPNATPDERRAERKKIAEYLKVIKGKDPEDDDATSKIYNNILIGWMDRLLDPANVNKAGQPKNFQGRYYRKDPTFIPPGTPLSDAIPIDYDPATNWQGVDGSLSPLTANNPYEVTHQPRPLNAMFRFDEDRLLPYLHCEVDGNYIQILLDELSLTISAFGIAYGFACLFTPWAIVIGALLALLIFLLQRWLDGGSGRGDADPVDVNFDDPDNFGEDGQQLDGDLVTIRGPWIMDTEHAQYFEIHAVQAYYVLGRNTRSGEIDLFDSAADQHESGTERLHNGLVDAAMVNEICGLANQAEGTDPPILLTRDAPTVLSHGLTTYYGGGGFRPAVQ